MDTDKQSTTDTSNQDLSDIYTGRPVSADESSIKIGIADVSRARWARRKGKCTIDPPTSDW